MSERKTLTMERTFDAPAERVFDAFTREEVLRRWFHAHPDWETPEARVDLRIGGEVRIVMHNPDKDENYGARGRYTEIDPPRRLAFTWLWDEPEHDQVEQMIEIDFTETDGRTTMRFVHRDLWNDEVAVDHEDGWTKCFNNLQRVVEAPGAGT
jgi:uncharacterized protein YndB with AHSA1/START domain